MSAVPKASNSLALPMGNAAGMGRVCVHLDVKALRQGRQQGLGICQRTTGACAKAARVRPIPNSA
jgi:hypothetical protein